MDPQSAAEKAVSVIGSGYDLTNDIRFSSCKSSSLRLLDFKGRPTNDLLVPGLGLVVKDVPAGIKCDKGERTRFRSDVLSFNQMSEYFNKELSLTGKIPSGLFNAMFDFKNCWQKDAAATKSLALDGWFISLYNIELERSHIMLSDHVKQQVPSSWDPPALAEFIERYGTHIVVGVKMGGKEVLHIKQMQTSNLDPTQVQNSLKQLADQRFSADVNTTSFSGGTPIQLQKKKQQQVKVKVKKENVHENIQGVFAVQPPIIILSKNKDTVSICVRRGGIDEGQSHKQWLTTIPQSPDVISMSLVPITSLLSSVKGCGFLNHAVNLYIRYKPPIEELHQFLEFQLPRQWAPVYADLPLGPRIRKHPTPSLQFSLMGPKLYVNTMQVDSGKKPVTGIRLYLEGKRSNHLAIHLQHLCDLPNTLHIYDNDHNTHTPVAAPAIDRAYFEPVKWSIFSHVYTAPIQYNSATIDDSARIVTKAWFEVKDMGIINKRVLFLRLGFSMVASSKIRRSEWDVPSNMSRKSGLFSTLINTSTNLKQQQQQQQQQQKQQKVDLNSAVYPGGPPSPSNPPKMTNFVDTKEMVRGPEDPPGYWVVTGAKLCVEAGKISIKPKYSLLTLLSEDSIVLM